MQFACISDIGLYREKNQDSYCAIQNEYGDFLAIVADGIGGGRAGEVASSEVIKYFNEIFKNSGPFSSVENIASYLNFHIAKINEIVYSMSIENKEYAGMGTTITGVFISKDNVVTFNCGDSRVYGFEDNKMHMLTKDHSLVNQMIDKGQITVEESINHPKKHYLVKAIGIFPNVVADIREAKNMDYYLVCSDGLHGYVSDEEIFNIVSQEFKTIEEKVEELKDISLMKGGYDNITAVLISK